METQGLSHPQRHSPEPHVEKIVMKRKPLIALLSLVLILSTGAADAGLFRFGRCTLGHLLCGRRVSTCRAHKPKCSARQPAEKDAATPSLSPSPSDKLEQ